MTFRAHTVHDVDVEAELAKAGIGVPCFVKPARLGSSVGISKVTGIDGLARRSSSRSSTTRRCWSRRWCAGIEVECGVLGNHNPMVSVVGRLHVNADWYDYDAKYEPGGMELRCRPSCPEVTDELQRVALLAFDVCECAGMARIDFFVTDEGAGRPERDQHDPRVHRDERLRAALRGLRHPVPGAARPADRARHRAAPRRPAIPALTATAWGQALLGAWPRRFSRVGRR